MFTYTLGSCLCTKSGGRDRGFSFIRYLLLYTTRVRKLEKYSFAVSGMDSKEYALRRLCMFLRISYSYLLMHVYAIYICPCNAYRKGKPAFLPSTSPDYEDLFERPRRVIFSICNLKLHCCVTIQVCLQT